MKTKLLLILALASLSHAALAAPSTFDFKDPKGVNNASFKLDAPLEAVHGTADGVSGSVTFDPTAPAATKGKITITTASMRVANSGMQGHMLGDQWMDAAKFPEITFETKELKNVQTQGDVTTADAVGTFTMKGVSKEITAPVKLTYLKDKLNQRLPKMNGDLLVVRSTFTINRSDFGIMPGKMADKVAETIELSLSIAGAAAK